MNPTTVLHKLLFIGVVLAGQATLAQTFPASTPAPVKAWYSAWLNKDWNSLQQSLADGFTFSSPLDDHINVAAVKQRCWPNAYNIKRMEIDKLVVEGENVMVIGTGWTNSGKSFRNCDYFKLKDGKIRSYECFFGPGINFPNSGK